MALRPISRIPDFHFPPDSWDVRGWTVRTEPDGKKAGQVDDMLLDASGQLRYLDVDLGFMKKHVLVALDRAHADRDKKTVWVEGLTKTRLEEAPEYVLEPELLDESYERRLDAYFGAHSDPAKRSDVPGETAAAEPAGVEERADMAGDPAAAVELRRMTDMAKDYQVSGDDPRGWKVVTGEGETVGRVAELLVSPGEMKARFLDIAVDEKELGFERVDRHVLLPSERVQLDRSSKKVVVSGLLASDLAEYPQYGGLPLTRGQARDIHSYFGRAGTEATPSSGAAGRARTTGESSDLHHFYNRGRPHEGQPATEA